MTPSSGLLYCSGYWHCDKRKVVHTSSCDRAAGFSGQCGWARYHPLEKFHAERGSPVQTRRERVGLRWRSVAYENNDHEDGGMKEISGRAFAERFALNPSSFAWLLGAGASATAG